MDRWKIMFDRGKERKRKKVEERDGVRSGESGLTRLFRKTLWEIGQDSFFLFYFLFFNSHLILAGPI